MNIHEMKKENKKKIFIYGKSGSGKTSSLHTLPKEAQPVLIFDVENKLESLLNVVDKDFQAEVFRGSSSELLELLNKEQFNTLVIDSFTFLQRRIENKFSNLKNNERTRMQYYDAILDNTIKIVETILSRDMNIIATCLEEVEGLTGNYSGLPMLTGKIKSLITSFFDYVLYSTVIDKQYVWICNNTDRYPCKVPYRNFPSIIEQDYTKIWRQHG